MHRPITSAAILITALALTSCDRPEPPPEAAAEAPATPLFNGENLDGWSSVLVDDSLTKEDVWSVRDGILVCKGEPLGYLHTDASYQDFVLRLEWRWAPDTTPTNSGVLLRIAGEPETFLPKCVEAQLKHDNAGDLYGFYGASLSGDPDRLETIQHEEIGEFQSLPKLKAAEKPAGEWNSYEIKVSGGDVELHINGELVNRGSGLDLVSGPIGLQSEGSEIHFRNIELAPLAQP